MQFAASYFLCVQWYRRIYTIQHIAVLDVDRRWYLFKPQTVDKFEIAVSSLRVKKHVSILTIKVSKWSGMLKNFELYFDARYVVLMCSCKLPDFIETLVILFACETQVGIKFIRFGQVTNSCVFWHKNY